MVASQFLEEARAGTLKLQHKKKQWGEHPIRIAATFSQIIDLVDLLQDSEVGALCIDAARTLADMYDSDLGFIPSKLFSAQGAEKKPPQFLVSSAGPTMKLLLWASQRDDSRPYKKMAHNIYTFFLQNVLREDWTVPDLVETNESGYLEEKINAGVADETGKAHHSRNSAFAMDIFTQGALYFGDDVYNVNGCQYNAEELKMKYFKNFERLVAKHDHKVPADFFDTERIKDVSGQLKFAYNFQQSGLNDASYRLLLRSFDYLLAAEKFGCVLGSTCQQRSTRDFFDVGHVVAEALLIDILKN